MAEDFSVTNEAHSDISGKLDNKEPDDRVMGFEPNPKKDPYRLYGLGGFSKKQTHPAGGWDTSQSEEKPKEPKPKKPKPNLIPQPDDPEPKPLKPNPKPGDGGDGGNGGGGGGASGGSLGAGGVVEMGPVNFNQS
jgi:hypothetical protein